MWGFARILKVFCNFVIKVLIQIKTLALEGNTETIATKGENEVVTSIKKFDIVGHLPTEIAQQILCGLSPEDLRSASLCCASWSAALSDDYFWKRRCERDRHLEVEESERSEFYYNFLTKYNYWQGVYWYNYTVQRNWETDNYREVTHKIKQSDVLAMGLWNFGDVIAFSQCDKDGANICIRDLKREKQTVFEIPNNRNPVNVLRSGNYMIYINYVDDNMKLWDFVNQTTIFNYYNSVYEITDVQVDGNLIVFERQIKGLQVYNIETEKTEYKYIGDVDNLILKNGNIIFTNTNVICVLKWHDKSIVRLTCCRSDNIQKLLLKNNLLLSFCENCPNFLSILTVCIWCITTNTKLHSTLLGPMPDLRDISLIDKYFYVERQNWGLNNKVIELWDYMKRTPEAAIVVRTNQNLYSSSNDHFMLSSDALNIWCLRTRNFIPIVNLSPAPDDEYEVELSNTKLSYVIRSTNEERRSDTITIHQRDYEI